MRLVKYATLDQLIYWCETTQPFTFEGTLVNPASQWEALCTVILPFLNGSMDNPYSTTTPKEKLPEYFSTAAQIGSYLQDEYEDRLVAVPFRCGEYYYKLGRNLNKDEAFELIIQELISKAYNFVSVFGYKFIKLFGTSSLNYDPRYSIQEHIRKVFDYGAHDVDNNYGARLRTDNLGNTSQTNLYGNTAGGETLGQHTDLHKETQMNDVVNPKLKTQDEWGSQTNTHHEDTHTDTITTTAVINTSGDAAVKDTMSSKAHQDVHTTDRESTGVKTIQELLQAERDLLNWNPVEEFFKAFTDKILLRCYYY